MLQGSAENPDLSSPDVRVVVGIDFGTTFSGLAYANKANPDQIETHETWPEQRGTLKTPTALLYDGDAVVKWGAPALSDKPRRKRGGAVSLADTRPVELFKLHLCNGDEHKRPYLPAGIDYKRAITDYLRELRKLMYQTVEKRWPGINVHKHVLKVMTVPAEYDEKARFILRTCAYNAGIIDTVNSTMLEFTSEPEAAAIHCIRVLKEHGLQEGSSFLIVDCGGGTVDLTMRVLQEGNRLSEQTERTGDYCGSTYVDKQFCKYIENLVGRSAMKMLEEKHYSQLQYMVQQFCLRIKFEFTGDRSKFQTKELDLEEACPVLMQYVTGEHRETLEEHEWLVEFDFDTVKGFFDPVVDRIVELTEQQVRAASQKPDAIFLVGGFAESPYVLQRMQAFSPIMVAVPTEPIASVVRGAVQYGIDMATIQTRVLKRSYGIRLEREWRRDDPEERRTARSRIKYFKLLAKRGEEVPVDAEFFQGLTPSYPDQTEMDINIFVSESEQPKYCDEEGVEYFGALTVDLPDRHLGRSRLVDFTLTFGQMETKAVALNRMNNSRYEANFSLIF